MTGISKINFGAYDVSQSGGIVVAPAGISNTPFQDKHGNIENDLYGTKKATASPIRSYSSSEPAGINYYSQQNSRSNKGSLLKTFLVIGGLGAVGVLAYKKRHSISGLFKKIFKKGDKTSTDSKSVDVKKELHKIVPVSNYKKFQEYSTQVIADAKNDNFDNINPQSFRVIFEHKSTDEKKKALLDLYEVAKIYTQKDVKPRVVLIMPESLSDKSDNIVDLFGKNRADEIKSKYISKMEGFQITVAKSQIEGAHDMIVDKQVRYGVNAESTTDVVGRGIRSFIAFIKAKI